MDNSSFDPKVAQNAPGGNTEKVSVNMNTATLSSIDLLVDNGYYSNRSDFINQAVREALSRQQTTIDRIAGQNITSSAAVGDKWFLGIYSISAEEISRASEKGENYSMKGYGLLRIDPSCNEEQLFSVISSIQFRGKVVASDTVKAHYGLK